MRKTKCCALLSSIAISLGIVSALTINVHAAVKAYIVKDTTDTSKVIRFDFNDLLADYTNKLSGAASPMFDEYFKDAANLVAFQDSIKGYVSADAVEAEYAKAMSTGNQFDVDNFTENVSTADIITGLTVGYEWSVKDSKVIPFIMPTATIEQAGTAITGNTVVVASLPSTVDASGYNVTVNGVALTYDAATGKFTGTIEGTYTIQQLQDKTIVSLKDDNTSDEFDVSDIY